MTNYKQIYLIFQPISNTFRKPTGVTETIVAWKSKGLSDESIKLTNTQGINLVPKLKWIHNSKITLEVRGSCSKQDKSRYFIHRYVINFFILYELDIFETLICSRELK